MKYKYIITPISNLRKQRTSDISIESRELVESLYEFDAETEGFRIDKSGCQIETPKMQKIVVKCFGRPNALIYEKISKKESFDAILEQDGECSFILYNIT